MQTSCHRCPSALHNRLVTSTPSLSPLSLIHHVRFDASSGPLAARASPRARSREPRPSREKRWRGHWPGRGGGIPVEENASSITATPELARGDGVATGPVARGPPSREKRTYTHRYAAAATRRASRRVGAAEGLVSVAPGLDPAKAATAPVIGIIIEFLPTDPCQTARGDSCARRDTTERHKLAQLRPVHGLHAHRL